MSLSWQERKKIPPLPFLSKENLRSSTSESQLSESVSGDQAEKTQETHAADEEEPPYSLFYSLPSLPLPLSLSLSLSHSHLTFVGGVNKNRMK